MEESRQLKFINAYLANNSEQVKSFRYALNDLPTGTIVARSPILLRIAVWIWKESGSLPKGLAQLYSIFFRSWLRREVTKDLISGALHIWNEEQAQEALSLLAYSMRKDELVSCSQEYAVECLKIALGERSKAFVERFSQGLMIERVRSGSSMRFMHETIQEYLVAVFLTSHSEHELVNVGKAINSSLWSMPIVFAFELFEMPPEHFVQAAWQIAPLLVCAALSDDERLSALPEPKRRHLEPQNDLWVRGVIRCMRGESTGDITRSIALLGRTPSPGRYFQKHPLPSELTSTLEGSAFWYALKLHDNGRVRVERLQHMIIDQESWWIELLPHVMAGQHDWLVHLSDAQKLIVGELEENLRVSALEGASVVELCYLLRNKIIPVEDFRKLWNRALKRQDPEVIEVGMLALLATKEIKASQFSGVNRAVLKNLGHSHILSPRIIKVLAQDKIIVPEEVRKDPEQIKRLADQVSPIRAKQLVAERILCRKDFTDKQIQSLLSRIETDKDIGFILDAGLIESRQLIPQSIKSRVHNRSNVNRDGAEESTAPVIRHVLFEMTSEVISKIYLSREQLLLAEIQCEVKKTSNFLPGSGYHKVLAEHLKKSKDWPSQERQLLIDLAENFFRDHGSKKNQSEYRSIIHLARQEVQDQKTAESSI